MGKIPVAGPWITSKEIEYVTDAVTNAWYENANVYNERFERAFAQYVGVRHALSLPSCTSAIHLALLALDIKSGDEVIVPDATWIASAAPVSYVGASPVFADIDPLTWCISAESFEACIGPKTKAAIVVDLYGNMPDMAAIEAIAHRYKIALIEDAAEAVGAEYQRRKAGAFGDAATFSFHGSKTLTTGEGGMLVTNSDDIYERAYILRDHGRKRGDRMFYNDEVAYKYKMSSLQAALGLAQLERIDMLLARKRQAFQWYKDELDGIEGLMLNYEAPTTKNVYWMNTIVLDTKFGIKKELLMDLLNEQSIDCRPFFHPLSSLPAYAGLESAKVAKQRNSIAYRVCPYGINLPSALNLDQASVQTVCSALKKILFARS